MNSNRRMAAAVYSLGTMFVSGIYLQIPCIKEIMTIIIIIIIIIFRPLKYIKLRLQFANSFCIGR
jgi:hypothetical protein